LSVNGDRASGASEVGIGLSFRRFSCWSFWYELLVVDAALRPATKIWNLYSRNGTVGDMDLNEMLVFARVVQTASFTTAGEPVDARPESG
jgi:hypothetical protein